MTRQHKSSREYLASSVPVIHCGGACQRTVFAPVDGIPHFAVFVECRGSNATNNEHDLIAFRSQVKTMYFDVRNHLVISDSKRATLLLSKLHAWINELDGRGMLSVNQFLIISSTFPIDRTPMLSPSESQTPKGVKLYNKTLSSI